MKERESLEVEKPGGTANLSLDKMKTDEEEIERSFLEEEEKLQEMDEENEVKLIPILANHMKKSFIVWNKDASVEDQKIFADLYEISNGRLSLSSDNLRLRDGKDLIGASVVNVKKNNNNKNNKPKAKK